MDITKLQKSKRSRLEHVDTYKVACDNPKKYIRALKSLKSGNENGSGINEFVGKLKSMNKTCVIKVHFTNSKFTERELQIMNLLRDCPYVVKHICTYSCFDDKTRWMEALSKPQTTCHELTFIVMDYIENGDLIEFLKNATTLQIKALCIQCALAIIDMSQKYNVSQGDFNSGNVLIKLDKPSKKSVRIGKHSFTFDTHGVQPLFIDFGRGYICKTSTRYIIEDITTLFAIIANYIPDIAFKEYLNNVVLNISRKHKPHFSHVFDPILT